MLVNKLISNFSTNKAFNACQNWAVFAANERSYYYTNWLQAVYSQIDQNLGTSFNNTNPLLISLPISLLFHASLFYIALPYIADNKPIKVKPSQTLEITLLNIKSEKKPPDKAEIISQINTETSGSSNIKARPMSNNTVPKISANKKEISEAMKFSSQKKNSNAQKIITTTHTALYKATPPENKEKQTQAKPIKTASHNETSSPSEVDDILAQIEKLQIEIGADNINYNKRPKIRFLDTLAAKSTEEAEYLTKWAKRIENIGTQYFPKMAIKKNLDGLLILQVVLDHNGKVISAEIQSSSGFDILDNGAMRIIKLAAPFPPLPMAITAKWDQLSITRTWVFRGDVTTPIYTE